MDRIKDDGKFNLTFLGNFANELKVPVNIIAGFTALMGEPDIDEKARESYKIILIEAADRLMSMAYDLQEICSIKSGRTNVEMTKVRLNKMLRGLHEKYTKNAVEKGIKLSLDLFERGGEVEILTDNNKLHKILSNLLSNAVKFTSEGFVRFGYRIKDDFIEFHVSDSGIGIQEQYLENIFDHNFSNDNPLSQSYSGTGLGLYISKAYVELLGGNISVSSKPGSGSVFRFTIPVKKSDPVIHEEPVENINELCIFSEKKVILVAEDMDSNFMLIKLFLKDRNVEIIRANNGKEAIDIVLSGVAIDIILMDIKMPVMDGLTAIRKIREAGYSMPVIAQTAYIDDKQIALDNGGNGFISKPFDKKRLLMVLSEYLG